MTAYLLDTNILIELERSAPASLVRRLGSAQGRLWASSVSVMELFFGVAKSRDSERAEQSTREVLSLLHTADFNEGDGEEAGRLRGELARGGNSIGAYDILIAGQARARGMVLVTNNTREFERVPGLRVENWMVA